MILPASFVNISGKRQIVAYTCLLVTGLSLIHIFQLINGKEVTEYKDDVVICE